MIVSVSKDSGISEIDGLSGERYNYGGTGTTGALVAKNIFDLLGINVNSFEASQSDAADAYSSRQIRGTIKFGSIAADSYVMQLNAALPINILGFTDEQIEKITKEYPYLSEITIPAGVYEGVDYEVKTVAFYQGATSTTNLSQEDGYKIVKAVYELGKATIDAGFPMGANDDIMKMALTSPIPLHAGTVQYMMEIGIDVPQDLIPEEYVAN
jgi:TRAP transporter TAXI family solute receptor